MRSPHVFHYVYDIDHACAHKHIAIFPFRIMITIFLYPILDFKEFALFMFYDSTYFRFFNADLGPTNYVLGLPHLGFGDERWVAISIEI